MSSLPPLPPGFTLDPPPQAADNVPPLPPGFTLDAQPSAPRPRVYDPFASDERALPPLPDEQIIPTRSPSPERPSYFERIGQALTAPGTTADPQNIGERIGNVPGLGPLYGLAEAGTTLLTGVAALPLASAKGMIEGREPTSEDIAQFTYEPRSQIGRATLGLAGAAAQPVMDVAEEFGADVALLPLAAEMQALGTVARGRKELKQTKAEGERLTAPPSREELATAAKEAYDQARAAGAVAAPESYARMASGLRESLRQEGFNRRLHPKAAAVVAEIEKTAGKPVALDEIEILRRQALAAERSIEADERRIAGLIIDRLDDYADALASGAEPIVGGNAKAAVAARKQARNFYARSRKAQEMQELMERAEVRASQFSGSGLENALRTEFRQLAMNPKRLRRFTQEEQRAIKEVAFGTPTSNTLRQIGKLAPTGGLMQSLSLLGAVLEPTTLVAPAIGGAARIGATKLTQRAARRAEEIMRRGSTQPARAAVESAEATAPAIEGELPAPTQNLFAQLSRSEEADRAGAAFEAERAAAAARGGIDVQELPVREIVLESPPAAAAAAPSTREIRNALARLADPVEEVAPEPIRVAAKSAVATRSERRPKNALAQLAPGGARTVEAIEADLKKLEAKAQRLPQDEPFDSPRMKAIESEYEQLRKELATAKRSAR